MKNKYYTEIYLAKKSISKDEWNRIVKKIVHYVGVFRMWRFIIEIDANNIRYLLETDRRMPVMMVGVEECLFKECSKVEPLSYKNGGPRLVDSGANIADLVTEAKVKKDVEIVRVEIQVFSLNRDVQHVKAYAYELGRVLKKRRLIISSLEDLLSIDFDKNKLFFYKKVPKYLDIQKALHLLKSEIGNALFEVDTFPYLSGKYYLDINSYNFFKHSLVVGSSGSGKSKFLSLFIQRIANNPDYQMKYRVIVLDPHASLEEDIGGLTDAIVDFKTDEKSLDIFKKGDMEDNLISSSELLFDLLIGLLGDNRNPKLERLLRQCINLLLGSRKFSFNNLRKVLLDAEYRLQMIKENVQNINDSTRNFFLTDYNDFKTKYYNETIAPIIAFVDEMQLLPVFNKESDGKSLEEVVAENFLTIFSLDSEKLGKKVVKVIAGLIMKQVLELAESRRTDKEIILIVDEVAVIENPVLQKILAEARKYGLHLVLAEQYFDQVSDELKTAIFANVLNYYLFRVSKKDAEVLVHNINVKIPVDDTAEAKENMLSMLNDRECVLRLTQNGILLPAMKARTVDFESIPKKKVDILPPLVKLDAKDRELIENKKFAIDGDIQLRDLMMNQSSSKEKRRK